MLLFTQAIEENILESDLKTEIETLKKVRRTITKYNMINKSDLVIVAVSGGADSVCLLDILHELKDDLGIELVVAHFDHGLRPSEDEAEGRFVESLALSYNFLFESKKAHPSIETGNSSFEEIARHARYVFLEEVKDRLDAQKIAVAHNLNDQAETVLMRLFRGSGPSGLAGIPPCRDNEIIRPLIEIGRKEIEAYLDQRNLMFMTDSSNLETRYLRNKIRLELLPQLEKYQPRIVEILGKTAEIMRNDEAWVETKAADWLKAKAEKRTESEILIPLSSFIKLPYSLKNRILRHAIKMTGGDLRRVRLRHIEAINQMSVGKKPQAQINLPNRLIVNRVYNKMVFSAAGKREPKGFRYSLDGLGSFNLEALACTISLEEIEEPALPKYKSSWTAFLNADHIIYPLVVRNFLPGDRFIPLGMTGHKKLKDFFIDLKISSEARKRIPILAHEKTIIWICGLRIDDRFKVTPDTKKILKFTFDKRPIIL